MRQYFSFAIFSQPRRANPLLLAAAMFALGLRRGRRSDRHSRRTVQLRPEPALPQQRQRTRAGRHAVAHRRDPSIVYPSTCCASSTATPSRRGFRSGRGSTSIPRCGCAASTPRSCMRAAPANSSEAEAARAALEKILAEGGVTISRVGVDKYGGRVDADRDPLHRRRLGGIAQRRLCARLRRRQARHLVRMQADSRTATKEQPPFLIRHRSDPGYWSPPPCAHTDAAV